MQWSPDPLMSRLKKTSAALAGNDIYGGKCNHC